MSILHRCTCADALNVLIVLTVQSFFVMVMGNILTGLHTYYLFQGSCTMKLNSTTEMMACSNPNIANIHPFAPIEQTFGYRCVVCKRES